MVGGNPFARKGDKEEDLLAGAERSDAPWHSEDEEEQARSQQPAGSATRRQQSLSPPAADAARAESTGLEAAYGSAPASAAGVPSVPPAADAPPPPPPLVPSLPPQPAAGQPPPYGAAPPPGVVPGMSYYPQAPGTAGAWGSSASNGGGDGMYGFPGSQHYGGPPQYPPPGQPGGAAPAWTAGYPTDQPLTYHSFEQQGGPPPGRMKCGGLGEQWTLFLVGLLVWPVWYFASVWYCVSRAQQQDPRQKAPFILNTMAAVVFTVVWVSLVARHTWYCGADTGRQCW